MPYLPLLTVISIGFFLIPDSVYASTPVLTFQHMIANLLGFVATIGILILPLVILAGTFYGLWRYWRKKPVKRIIWIFAKIVIILLLLIVILLFIRWILIVSDKTPTPPPYLELDL